jgi:RNA polymerase sigma factor (sigma-70 family)
MTAENQLSELLVRLKGRDHQSAWSEFLATHSGTIQLVAHRFERDPDLQGDCFVFACEHLARNQYRRLRSFEPDGPAAFRTWLMAVVLNLAIDWRRSVRGRARPFKSISEMGPTEIEVYRSVFERGMSLEQAHAALLQEGSDLTMSDLSEMVATLHETLTPRQNWLLSVRHPSLLSIENLAGDSVDPEALSILASSEDGPDSLAEQSERRRCLMKAMAVLEVDERLAVRLRYQEGLTLREIGRQMNIGDPFRVRRLVDRALKRLRENWPTTEKSPAQSKTKGAVRVMKVKRMRIKPDV